MTTPESPTPAPLSTVKGFADRFEDDPLTEEDKAAMERLRRVPKDVFIEHHNFYSFAKENTARELQRAVSLLETQEPDRRRDARLFYAREMLAIAKRQKWPVIWRVNIAFENLDRFWFVQD
ncbi:MAG: hypothetical protein Q7R83_02435 [bacterium]|nr:hypothetical protein [bacterium]